MPPPSLILLDIQLPNVDGVTILETIRATPDWQDVPVIMLTAVSEEQRIRKVLSLTVQGYVLKPFKQETLVSCVEQARMRLPRPC
jgi:CheY-like chemotaxis protein